MSPQPGRSRKRAPSRVEPPRRRANPFRAWALNGPAEIPPAEAMWLRRLAALLAAALGAALVFMVLGPHRIGDYFTETDFYGGYAEGARLIQQGRFDPSRYGVVGPGYEVALALAGFALRNLFIAAEWLSLISTVATLLLLFDMLARRAGERVALLAALIFAVNPWVFRFGYIASTDAFSITLQVLALWLMLARRTRGATLAAGLVAAAAFLTRYNAVYLLPAGLILTWSEARRARAEGAGDPPAARAGIFAAGFIVPVAAWVLWCVASGAPPSFQLFHNIAYEVYARHQGMVWDDYQKKLQPEFHSLWDVVRRDPPMFWTRMAINVFDHLRLDAEKMLGWPAAIAVLLGIVLSLVSGARRIAAPFLVAGGLLFLSLVPTFYSERYSMALLPIYAALAGLFFGLPRFALALKARPFWLKAALVAVPVAFAIRESVTIERDAISQLPVEVLDAARALKAMAAPGDAVIARKPHLAFHAGLRAVAFPFTSTIPELADYARQNHVRWLYISWPEVETRPRYWHMLDTTGAIPGLTPRHLTAPHPAVVYEIGPEFGRLPDWYSNDTLLTLHTARSQFLVNPGDPQALYSIGLVMRAQHQPDSARRYMDLALDVKPHFLAALLIAGELALQRNDIPTALDDFGTAVRYHPSSVDAKVGLGWATLISGDIPEAARIWRPMVGITQDPNTLQRMVAVYERVGDEATRREAQARLARVLAGEK